MRNLLTGVILIALFGVMLIMPEVSRSVPSFARQTELACSNCHTVFPELNSFGRLFKLNGYTLSSDQAIESKGSGDKDNLKLPKIPPFSAALQASYSNLSKPFQGTQNGNVGFPQEFSFFFAGEISPHIGGFLQVTWDDQSTAFDFDRIDIRYANQGTLAKRDIIYGLTLNNGPTIQDVWNSTPAWSFPYASSGVAPTPGASPLISGGLEGLEQRFAGLGAYALYNNLVYAEFSLYRSTAQGEVPHPPDSTSTNVTNGVAPYWRLALQHQWPEEYLSGGTFGFSGKFYPTGISGSTNTFTDIGADAQSTTRFGSGMLTAHAMWVHEKQNLDAAFAAGATQNPSNNLNLFKIDANYYFDQRYGIAAAFFTTSGDSDTLLYTPGLNTGYSGGKPNSSGEIIELDYLPWLNTKLALQYVIYSKFNGASNNYDGFGRNASDNNTLYVLAWLAM